MNTYQMHSHRLSIDFEIYTDGNCEFKQELVVLMIQNLRELDQALESGARHQDHLKKTIHKMAATISMINDPELMAILPFMKQTDLDNDVLQAVLNEFRVHCDAIIRCLEYELELEAVPVKAA
jgi:hypothetical protein